MFNQMDNAFARTTFEPTNDLQFMIRTFLVRFDAIFTLNQDLLLERHYLDGECSPFVRAKMGWRYRRFLVMA